MQVLFIPRRLFALRRCQVRRCPWIAESGTAEPHGILSATRPHQGYNISTYCGFFRIAPRRQQGLSDLKTQFISVNDTGPVEHLQSF